MKKLSGQWSSDDAITGQQELTADQAGAADDHRAGGAISSLRGRLAALTDAGGRA